MQRRAAEEEEIDSKQNEEQSALSHSGGDRVAVAEWHITGPHLEQWALFLFGDFSYS